MSKLILSMSEILELTSNIFGMFFSDSDISDIEKKNILKDPVDREIYLKKLDELKEGKESEINVPLVNHQPFTLYSKNGSVNINGI